MKYKKLALFLSFFFLHRTTALAETPRPISATSIYNGSTGPNSGGILYVPSVTPFGNRACYFDNNSAVASSVTTAQELTYLSGVTGPIQAQINALVPGGGYSRVTNTVSAGFIIPTLTRDYILNVNTNSGAVTITLSDAIASNGFCEDVKNIGSNVISVTTQSGQVIDGNVSDSITDRTDSKHYCAVSGNWFKY